MRTDTDKRGEEILLDAIGNLPEDMIVQAAEYKPRRYVSVLYRGLIMAACLAFVIFAGTEGGKMFRSYLDSKRSLSVKSSGVEDYASGTLHSENDGEHEKACIWADAKWYRRRTQKETDTVGKMSAHKVKARGMELLEEGKTVALTISQEEGQGKEEIPVITLTMKGEAEEIYLLQSQVGNCKIVSLPKQNRRNINLSEAEIGFGDVIKLDTRQRVSPSWSEVLVPEWDSWEIQIIDILTIKTQEGRNAGRIVIGRKNKKYFGIYQNKK